MKNLNMRGFVFLAIILMIYTWPISGCGQSRNDISNREQMKFDVIDSLLGKPYEFTDAGISIRPPAAFQILPDSMLTALREKFEGVLKDSGAVELSRMFIDRHTGAGMMIFTIRDLNLSSDTVAFVKKYKEALIDIYGSPNVVSGDYWIKEIFVKNYMITDSLNVRIQLLCRSQLNYGLEIQYYVSRDIYPKLIKTFESSIGSLKVIQNGGKE